MQRFKKFTLLEYLTPQQEKRYSKHEMTPEARATTDHFFGSGNDRVEEDIHNYQHDKSESHKKVEAHLGMNIEPEHYKQGVVSDPKYPDRKIKIGKLIKDDQIKRAFATDSTRAGSRTVQKPKMSVVRGVHVAGQTNPTPDALHPNGHSWAQQSCKNIENGDRSNYLPHEIKHGAVTVFGHDGDGKEIYRATLHPHTSADGQTIYKVNSEYGVKHPSFTAHAHDVAKRLSAKADPLDRDKKPKLFKIHPKVYNDMDTKYSHHPDTPSSAIDKLFTKDLEKSPGHIEALASSNNLSAGHIHKLIPNPKVHSEHLKSIIEKNPNINADHLHSILKDHVKRDDAGGIGPGITSAFVHPAFNEQHLDYAANSNHPGLHHLLSMHPKATGEHLTKILTNKKGDDSYYGAAAKIYATSHPNLPKEMIDKIASSKNPKEVKPLAASPVLHQHPEILEKLLTHPDPSVRQDTTYYNAHHLPKEKIDRALNDKDPKVRASLFTRDYTAANPRMSDEHIMNERKKANNITSEHVTKALDDPDPSVYGPVIGRNSVHRSLNADHVDYIMNHKNPGVTRAFLNHVMKPWEVADKNSLIHHVTKEHLNKALNHRNPYVRLAAEEALNEPGIKKKFNLSEGAITAGLGAVATGAAIGMGAAPLAAMAAGYGTHKLLQHVGKKIQKRFGPKKPMKPRKPMKPMKVKLRKLREALDPRGDNLNTRIARYQKVTRGPRKGMLSKPEINIRIATERLKLKRIKSEPRPNLPEQAAPKVIGTNCRNCIWWKEDTEKPVGKDELNANGGLKAPNEKYVEMSKNVDLVTLPGKGTSNTKAFCEHSDIHDWVTERMCCAKWDAKGTIRDYKGESPLIKEANMITFKQFVSEEKRLGKPFLTPGGPKKRAVYVRHPETGNTVKVNFGDPNMRIKKSDPERRKSFRARHNCENPGPRHKARYWSCKAW